MIVYFISIYLKTILIKKSPALARNPQLKGYCKRTRMVTPRKPNSAKRPVAKLVLSNFNRVTAHISGGKHNVRRHCKILVRGNGARDLPGTPYRCIRGPYDFFGHPDKTKRRSIYGLVKKNKKMRKKYLNLIYSFNKN